MRVGVVQLPVETWSDTVDRARELDAMGFEHLWLYDHLSWQRYRDLDWHATMPWLAGIAASTERIRLGTMVASPNLRHPLTLAKDAMSLDHISNGRFILGLGAGTAGFDGTVFGTEALTPAQRADRLDEYTKVLGGLLDGDLTNHQGTWFTVNEGRVIPGSVQQPRLPIALAGGGPRTIKLAATDADSWITTGNPLKVPDDLDEYQTVLTEQMALFNDTAEASGRDPNTIDKICFVSSAFALPMTSFQVFADLVGRLSNLGFTDVVVHDRRAVDPVLAYDPELIPAIADWHQSQ